MDDKRVTLVLPADLHDAIAELAKQEDRSFAAQLRILCRNALDARETQKAMVQHEAAQ